jgi:hypothetical protein
MMTIKPFSLALALGMAALPFTLGAAPVTQETPVRSRPDPQAPVLTVLQPGAQLPPSAAGVNTPSGWMAVQLAGPHEVYVDNKDVTKALDVKPGADLRIEPTPGAAILTQAAANDPVEITGLRGRWTQLRLNRPITGYAQVAATPAPAPAPAIARPATPAPVQTSAPAPATASAPAGPGRAVPMVQHQDGGLSALPRLFEGRFVTTRRALRPRRPYEYALQDHTGERIAYVDISRLLLTDQIENYIDRHVTAYGTAKAVPDTKDIVITLESLQLR